MDDFEARLEAMSKAAFGNGVKAFKIKAAKWLMEMGRDDLARGVLNMAEPPFVLPDLVDEEA